MFPTSCNQSQSKQTTNNDALKNAIIEKLTDVVKEAEELVRNWDTQIIYFQDDVHGW